MGANAFSSSEADVAPQRVGVDLQQRHDKIRIHPAHAAFGGDAEAGEMMPGGFHSPLRPFGTILVVNEAEVNVAVPIAALKSFG